MSVKYLGVIITSDLQWCSHISSVCAKAKRQIGLLYRHFNKASQSTIAQLYKSTVLPHLEYCCCMWEPHHSTYSRQLESVQKFAAKLATRRWSDSYDSLLARLNWPLLSIRHKQQKVTLCRRILREESAIPSTYFSPHPHPNPRRHHQCALYAPFARTSAFKFSYFISVVCVWSSLPSSVVNVTSSFSFKRCLKLLLSL